MDPSGGLFLGPVAGPFPRRATHAGVAEDSDSGKDYEQEDPRGRTSLKQSCPASGGSGTLHPFCGRNDMSDPAQFESFVLAYQDMVFSTAVRLLGNDAEAEDVSQEVFVRAWKHWDDLSGSTTAGGWLKTVARNLCLNHLQRYRARWKMFSDLAREDDDGEARELDFAAPETLDQVLLTGDQRELLEATIPKLPKDQRVALVLYHFEDMDYADIATHLGVSLGKVKTDIFRAREALRKKLQPARDSVGV